jgi:hypothetical protein
LCICPAIIFARIDILADSSKENDQTNILIDVSGANKLFTFGATKQKILEFMGGLQFFVH